MQDSILGWRDGQPYNLIFDDIYYSRHDGLQESDYIFLQHNQLPKRWLEQDSFCIVETGLGTGLNCALTLQRWLESARPEQTLSYISIEKYPLSKPQISEILSAWTGIDDGRDLLLQLYPGQKGDWHYAQAGNVRLILIWADVLQGLGQIQAKVDAWYLDGFAPSKNPDMWSEALFRQMANLSKAGSCFATFTAAGFVRRGLQAQGFEVFKDRGFGGKREMLYGQFSDAKRQICHHPYFEPQSYKGEKQLAIVGAGLAGCVLARVFADAGWQIDLLDRRAGAAQEGSANPAGLAMPLLHREPSKESRVYVQGNGWLWQWLQALQETDAGFAELFEQTGILQLESMDRIPALLRQAQEDGMAVERVNPQTALTQYQINLPGDALFIAEAGWVKTQAFCLRLLQHPNIRFHANTSLCTMQYTGQAWELLDDDGKSLLRACLLVLCNGEGIRQAVPELEDYLYTLRGQLTYVKPTEPNLLPGLPVCAQKFIVPLEDFAVMGASYHKEDGELALRQSDQQENIEGVNLFLRQALHAEKLPLQGRVGWRVVSKDHLPLVGPLMNVKNYLQQYARLEAGVPGKKFPKAQYLPGLYCSAAHGSRGLVSSFVAARLLYAQINGLPSPLPNELANGLHPGRFFIRDLRRGSIG